MGVRSNILLKRLSLFRYNIFKSLIEDAVKDALQKQLCPIVKNELGPANAALKKLPMNVSLTHGVVASYALTGNPIVTPDYLVTPHSGSFVPARVTAPCPFTAPVVPLLTTLPRMLYVRSQSPSHRRIPHDGHCYALPSGTFG